MISDEKFGKGEHILKTKDFKRVYNEGRSFRKDWLTLFILNTGVGFSRIGLSVSARSVKLAVKRNRIKRIFREVYRKSKKGLKSGYDIVVAVKKEPIGPLSYDIIKERFLEIADKAGVIK